MLLFVNVPTLIAKFNRVFSKSILFSVFILINGCSTEQVDKKPNREDSQSSVEYINPNRVEVDTGSEISIEANQTIDGEITNPVTDITIVVGTSIDFTATAFDVNNSLLKYRWDFGVAAPASDQLNVGLINFDQTGVYPVSFTVTNSQGVSDRSPSTRNITVIASSTGEGTFQLSRSLGDVVFTKNGIVTAPLSLDVGFGSGAYHLPGEDADVFYTITDRGPNIKCKDAEEIFGISNFCPENGDKIFPIPNFTPTIYRLKLLNTAFGLGYEILEEIPLKNSAGNPITGLTNNLISTTTEIPISSSASQLDFDNGGLDTEAIVRLSDGTFWLSDEYGPSLVHVAVDGTILMRVVPASVEYDLTDAGYPVIGLLPFILKNRKINRGIEGLAISPDESFLYFSMQSPLANPDKVAFSDSRHIRIVKLALDNGNISSVAGEYVYTLDSPDSFVDPNGIGDVGKKQKDVKVSELLAIDNDDLIVLERIKKVTKLYRVNLNSGKNIHHTPVASISLISKEDDTPKTLEQLYDLNSFHTQALRKILVFNTLTDMPTNIAAPEVIEGMALLDNERVLLISDNDFGIEGEKTTVVVLNIAQNLISTTSQSNNLSLSLIARHESGLFDKSAAEIVAFHKLSGRVFVLNAQENTVNILSGLSKLLMLDNPLLDSNLTTEISIPIELSYPDSGGINSIAIHGNLLAVAAQNKEAQAVGVVIFYSLNSITGAASHLNTIETCALPDSVVFTPNGAMLLVACEGEPNSDYSIDPEGKIASINIVAGVPINNAAIIGFRDFNEGGPRHSELPEGIRIYGGAFNGLKSSVAQDLEPEYLAVSKDSNTAYVSLQENNALAIIDLNSQRVIRIVNLGHKDYSNKSNALDVSDRDKDALTTGTLLSNGKSRINIKPWDNLVGLYQPDTIASYEANGETFVVSVNEGASREMVTGKIDTDFINQIDCETAGKNWDQTVNACFMGDTPTVCAARGFLNKANEECFSYTEEFRVEDLVTAGSYGDYISPIPVAISTIADNFSSDISKKINDNELGRLKISIVNTIDATTNTVLTLRSYGARSFSIWNESGQLVFDSGSDFAKITAGRLGQYFNSSNDRPPGHKKSDRSSAKGVEPAALTVGQVGTRTYAFVGLERVGGILIYDITSPYGVQFLEYTINRDFTKDPVDANEGAEAGDVGPEGMKFVPAIDSPTGQALLIVGNEISGTVSVYEIR